MDKDVEKLVRLLWRTTLIVDKTLRVKPLPIPWKKLSAAQQTQAIEHLRRLLTAELKKLASSDMRLRLEFESIPRNLRKMLIDVAGDDNPDVTWGRIGEDIP